MKGLEDVTMFVRRVFCSYHCTYSKFDYQSDFFLFFRCARRLFSLLGWNSLEKKLWFSNLHLFMNYDLCDTQTMDDGVRNKIHDKMLTSDNELILIMINM